MKRCSRCVLPEFWPFIRLNQDNVCNVCLRFEKDQQRGRIGYADLGKDLKITAGESGERKSKVGGEGFEKDLRIRLDKYRGKGKYDCLVTCSGGKDSTYTLYLMKKVYHFNPLAVTWDNGFETEAALDNVKNSVKKLKVDWIYLDESGFMKEFFSYLIRNKIKTSLCMFCHLYHMGKIMEVARQNGISLVVTGYSKGQVVPKYFRSPFRWRTERLPIFFHFIRFYLLHILRHPQFRKINFAKFLSRSSRDIEILSPLVYLKRNPAAEMKILKNELDWREPSQSYPRSSTNCSFNFLSVYLSRKSIGYSNYDIEMSTLIRVGEMTRQEALNALELEVEPELLEAIAGKLDLSLSDVL